uniref:Uncharacterized protein n=1 Tax=Anguilla anguilla TaxID=7936 RepID=A0A0E9V8F9_ANGAN
MPVRCVLLKKRCQF